MYAKALTAGVFRAFAAERAGKAEWDDAALLKLGKVNRVFAMLPIKYNLHNAKGVLKELGVENAFGPPEVRHFAIPELPPPEGLLRVLNARRAPSKRIRADKTNKPGLGKAIRAELTKVGMTFKKVKVAKDQQPLQTVVLPALVSEFLDVSTAGTETYDAMSDTWNRFWEKVYQGESCSDEAQE